MHRVFFDVIGPRFALGGNDAGRSFPPNDLPSVPVNTLLGLPVGSHKRDRRTDPVLIRMMTFVCPTCGPGLRSAPDQCGTHGAQSASDLPVRLDLDRETSGDT